MACVMQANTTFLESDQPEKNLRGSDCRKMDFYSLQHKIIQAEYFRRLQKRSKSSN